MNKLIKQAFTLIELLVVIAIIGILSGMIVVSMSGVTQKASIAKAQIFSNSLRNSLMANIVGEWRFDDITNYTESGGIKTIGTTSNNVVDSWNGNHGTASGGPILKEGTDCVFGKCILFDGSNDYVDFGNPNWLNTTGSMSAWIKPTSINAGQIISISDGDTSHNFIQFYTGSNALYLQIDTGGGIIINFSNPLMANSGWHHVVLTQNSTNVKMYIDGVLQTNTGGGQWLGSLSGLSHYRIGDTRYNNADTNWFNGLIDDVRIYNAALPTSQIKEQYYIGLNNMLNNGNISKEEYINRINNLIAKK
ncbi:MAG: LamG-like jellyroll fold domain-containing protein [Candidatus Paceibacterota bacterium]|jgi:prepilin-type N-terminal cleavage/methylation domain-containing protein